MKLFVAYVPHIGHPFYPEAMCREQDSGYSLVMRETEGATATIEIERRQTGLSILGSGRNRCAIVSWTPTGDIDDVVVLARGRMVDPPEDPLAATQTIVLECSPTDISEMLLKYCQEHLAEGPETDFLFSDADPQDVESYLLGRSGNLVVDPATHAISYSDDLVGERIHDLADGFVVSSSKGVYEAPVKTYRAKLVCDWTQEAEGSVDVASQFNRIGAFQTLDSSFASRIASSLSASGNEGWSTAGEVETTTTVSETLGQFTGSTYVEVGYQREAIYLGVTGGGYGVVRVNSTPTKTPHSVGVKFARYDVTIKRFPMSYSYSQGRRDVAYVALDVPVQDSAVVREEDIETIEMTLGDIFADATIPAWKTGEDYYRGDIVGFGGRYFECVRDHRSGQEFYEETGFTFRRRIPGINPPYYETTRTHWIRIRPTSIPTRAGTTKFLSSARGARCLRHAVLRLRKEGRRRLRAWHVVVEAEWAAAAAVRVQDSVSVLVPWDGEGAHRRAVGKVVGIERRWTGGEAPIVSIEIGIPFGLGGAPADGTGDAAYVEDGYVEDEYLGASGPTDFTMEVQADPPSVPVQADLLSSPGYSVMSADIVNLAGTQLATISETLAAGADITEISVRKPTMARLRMRPLVASSDPLERDIDVVATLLATPAGIDLS